jgi:hypothetical protein
MDIKASIRQMSEQASHKAADFEGLVAETIEYNGYVLLGDTVELRYLQARANVLNLLSRTVIALKQTDSL